MERLSVGPSEASLASGKLQVNFSLYLYVSVFICVSQLANYDIIDSSQSVCSFGQFGMLVSLSIMLAFLCVGQLGLSVS
jgi:hypothetical protein